MIFDNKSLTFRSAFGKIWAGLLVTLASTVAFGAKGPLDTPRGAVAAPAPTVGSHPIKILDMAEKPVSGVALMIQPRPTMLLPEKITETTSSITNDSGVLMTPEPEVGGTYFILRKPGFEAMAFSASRSLPTRATLRPGRSISGAIFTPDGQPISGAVVGPVMRSRDDNPHRGRQNPLPRMAVRTGPDGSFHLDNLPVDTVDVQLWAPGHTPRLVTFAPGETNKKFSLSSGGGVVKGTVLGSKDHAPQTAVPIEATSDGLILYTVTDAQGTYVLDNLPTGTWKLRPSGGGPLSGTQSRAKVIQIDQMNQVIDLQLVLNQGILLAGRAVDAVTSRGLAHINITLAGYGGKGAKAVYTDSDGSFAFENLDSLQEVTIRFDPVKFVYILPGGAYRDYFNISKVADTDFDITTMTIPLHHRLEMKGNVKDASGLPAPDVEIRMQSLNTIISRPSKSGPAPLTYTAYTNAAGDFRTGVYPAGQYKVWAQKDDLVSEVESVDAYTTAPVRPINLRLDRAGSIEGLVTDAHDAPVTAAIVIAWPADSAEPMEDPPIPGRETYQYSKTDTTGHFKLTGLRGEPLILRASHPAFVQSVHLPVDPAAIQSGTSSSLVLKFPAGGEFSALITNEQGEPLSAAQVQLDYTVGMDGRRVSVLSDEYGRGFIGAIPAAQADKLVINHPAYASYESDGPLTLPQANYKVVLKKRGSIIAHINGESPFAGVPIDVFLLHAPAVKGSTKEPPENGFEQTAQAGVVAGQAVFANLRAGWYKVAYANSGAFAESDAVLMEAGSGDHEVELTLPKGNHLTGIVKDKQTGEGIAGANVTLRPAIDSSIVTQRAMQNTTTGDGGKFELYNVGEGRLHVKALAAGYPDYEQNLDFNPDDALIIEMSNIPAALSGTVTSGGAPVEGALLVLAKSTGDHAPVGTAVTDETGVYKIEDFPAGSYTLAVEAPIGEGQNISRKSMTVNVEDKNATQNVEFAALVTVSGKVRLGGKTPSHESGAATTLLFNGVTDGAESKMVQINSDGSYSTQLEPGKYMVSLEDRESREVEVPAGSTAQINLDF